MLAIATAALVVVQGVAALRLRAPLPAIAPRTALRAGAVSLSEPPPEPVLVSSPTPGAEPVPVGEGDAVLCKDQASQAWWRATVRQTRGDQLLVHYMGCDDAWDEWFDASSPNICAVDAQEAARGAFQSEEAELELEGMGDEEILEAYRAQKWANNARWQLATFAQAQLGEWKGSCVAYEPSGPPGEAPKWVAGPSLPSAGAVAVERDGEVAWRDGPPDKAFDTSRTLTPASFDRQRGCACVGNGYSFTAGAGEHGEDAGADGALLFELGLREEGRRVRVKFAYAAAPEGDLSLERVLVAREAESGGGGAEKELPPGSGLYDPPPGDRTRYCSLYCDGGITLVFPASLGRDEPGFVSVDWTAGSMRYQLDRKFARLERRVGSLELTEVRREDAAVYPPGFKDSGQAGQD